MLRGLPWWLRLRTPNAEDLGSILGPETQSHMPQLRVCILQLKILNAATKTQCSQINIKKKKKTNNVLKERMSEFEGGKVYGNSIFSA